MARGPVAVDVEWATLATVIWVFRRGNTGACSEMSFAVVHALSRALGVLVECFAGADTRASIREPRGTSGALSS